MAIYDFSKSSDALIEKAVKAVEDQLKKTPTMSNRAELESYIQQGRAELNKRLMKKIGIGAAVVGGLFFLSKKGKRGKRGK